MAKEKKEARRPRTGEERFAAYLEAIAAVVGHSRRAAAARAYCTGLLLPGERKSIEPMAARLAPGRVQAKHQSLHHVVAKAEWDDAALLRAVREQALPAIEQHGPVCYWMVDDTAFPKQGEHSVVWRGSTAASWASRIAARWRSASRWRTAMPACRSPGGSTCPRPGPRIRRGGPRRGCRRRSASRPRPPSRSASSARRVRRGVPVGIVLGDAGYGDECDFRVGVAALDLRYVLGIRSGTGVWPPGQAPLPPAPWSGRGRPPTRLRRSPEHQPVSVKDLAASLPSRAWRDVTWREGSRTELTSRFAAVRVRPAHRDTLRAEPWPEEWLLIEWPRGAAEPAKYWLSNLPPRTALKDLVHTAKARWLIERDYQELKQEIGLGHYEGRGWRGFHHHASLCIAAYGFLMAERCLFPPQARFTARRLAAPMLPKGFQPRGAPGAA
jgi:SRSO17 transposase